MAQTRSHDDFDDNSPTQLMRTRTLHREEPASAVLPTVRPFRTRPGSVKLRRALATTRPPIAGQPRPTDAAHAPTLRPDLVPSAPDTAPLPPTLPEVPLQKRSVTPAMLPPWGDDPHARRARPASSTSTTYSTSPGQRADETGNTPRSGPEPSPSPLPIVSLSRATSSPPVQVSYRPLSLDLEPSRTDPGATQPSRRQRIESASRRNWAAMAICGGFLAGLIGSAVPFIASMTPGVAPARATRIHVTTPSTLAVMRSTRLKAVEVEESATMIPPRARRSASAKRAAHGAPASTHRAAPVADTSAPAPPAAHEVAAAKPEPEAPAAQSAPSAPAAEAKPADLNGRDLLSDGL